MNNSNRPAIFLDRDGVINVDTGYLHKIEEFKFIDLVKEALKLFKEKNYLLVLVTNQAGVAYGYYSENDVVTLNNWMQSELDKDGISFDGIYYCPHHPEKGIGKYLQKCNCRKPNIGMLERAHRDLKIDFSNSYMVGDRKSDVMTGKNANLKGSFLVKTGKPIDDDADSYCDGVYNNLLEIAKIVPKVDIL